MPRKSDEQDSTYALVLNYIVVILVVSGIFVSDWVFGKTVLSETIVAFIIGAVCGWVGAVNTYFFSLKPKRNDNGEETQANGNK